MLATSGPQRLAAIVAARLGAGEQPSAVVPPPIDIASSPATFIMVFDARHRVVASSGQLNGHLPVLPAGVLT